MVILREILCKSALSRSRIYGVDYSVNPYLGCQHSCVYCYARFMKKYRSHIERWGEFVDIKINMPQIISRELSKSKRGLVLVSSVTDPYQPIEEKYELTRKTLQRLLIYNFPISILTKSALVARDVDILRNFSECEIGITITSLDEKVRMNFEPEASRIRERLDALKKINDGGLRTYIFLGPILPFFIEETLEDLASECKNVGVSRVLIDRLNLKYGNWELLKEMLGKKYPYLLPKYEEILFSKSSYFESLKEKISTTFQKKNLKFNFCY